MVSRFLFHRDPSGSCLEEGWMEHRLGSEKPIRKYGTVQAGSKRGGLVWQGFSSLLSPGGSGCKWHFESKQVFTVESEIHRDPPK